VRTARGDREGGRAHGEVPRDERQHGEEEARHHGRHAAAPFPPAAPHHEGPGRRREEERARFEEERDPEEQPREKEPAAMCRPVEGHREDGERGDAHEAHEAIAEEEALVEDGGAVECREEPGHEGRARIEEPAGEPVDETCRRHAEKRLDEDHRPDAPARDAVDRRQDVGIERLLVERVPAEPAVPESPAASSNGPPAPESRYASRATPAWPLW